jgi:cytochrome c oxidase cbb3-type subunit 1
MSQVSVPPSPIRAVEPQDETARAEASARWVLLLLFWAAAKWLVLATLFGLAASMSFHAPRWFADTAWLGYGRMQPAFWNALLYGFGVQAGLGTMLWLLVRLGRAPLAFPATAFAGAYLWNLGVVVGLVGIFIGDSTGHPWLEMPAYAWPILFIAYLLVGLSALGTFSRRQDPELQPSQWYLLAAVFWFPWVYSTANVLLLCTPVRGILQSTVAWWYDAQFLLAWFGFIGLAVLHDLIPRLMGRPLYSRHHALLTFWLLVAFSGWRGIPLGAPVPAWMGSVGTVFAVFTLVPLVTLATNICGTVRGRLSGIRARWPLSLVLFATAAYFTAMVLDILRSVPEVSRVIEFTFFLPGVQQLFLYGFFAMTVFAVVYVAVPRLLPQAFPSCKLIGVHIGCFATGVVLQSLPLILGGVAQGLALNDPNRAFTDAFKPALMAFRLATLGDLLILIGVLVWAVNFGWGLVRMCRECCGPILRDAVRTQPAEAAR